eukprot:TRINITY_DN274_c0_g1_i1.p1 TRINITY_DN274_c0_g1~~TRINITY_DN274_c0_g1_i1.p1  ORF type:complete len:548 (-),score=141.19 TRINITY_DN274_c0_g1_i1:249-1817(-)
MSAPAPFRTLLLIFLAQFLFLSIFLFYKNSPKKDSVQESFGEVSKRDKVEVVDDKSDALNQAEWEKERQKFLDRENEWEKEKQELLTKEKELQRDLELAKQRSEQITKDLERERSSRRQNELRRAKEREEEKKKEELLEKERDQALKNAEERLQAFAARQIVEKKETQAELEEEVKKFYREIPDYRPNSCKNHQVPKEVEKRTISVVICYLNESVPILARTVSSLIIRTPPEMLHEIIMVDDLSSTKLPPLLSTHPKIKVLENSRREGLIRSRVKGADAATGDVLVFLDSHVEAGVNWAPALVERMITNYRAVAVPVIDVIEEEGTQKVVGADMRYKGVFDENLIFQWMLDSKRNENNLHEPYASPAMPGGLYAITKKYWEELGKYDMEMDVWGGENIEMSIKAWQCGGSIELVPCSHFGHVFRIKLPAPYQYPMDSGLVVKKNSLRVAAVWTDNYSKYFFQRLTGKENEEDVRAIVNFGDIGARSKLRKSLGCKSMEWYLDNVYPELKATILNNTKLNIPH